MRTSCASTDTTTECGPLRPHVTWVYMSHVPHCLADHSNRETESTYESSFMCVIISCSTLLYSLPLVLQEELRLYSDPYMCMQLFPYHLADYACRVLRVTPFRYYIDLLFTVMREEKSYDQIPNFTVRPPACHADLQKACSPTSLSLWQIPCSCVKWPMAESPEGMNSIQTVRSTAGTCFTCAE